MHKLFAFILLATAAIPLFAQNNGAASTSTDEPVVDKVIAIVGKNIVKLSDIENGYVPIRIRQGYDNAFENRCNILEGLLISKLLVHKGQIDSTDADISDESVAENVQYYMNAYEQQYGSKEAMRQATGYTYDELKDILGKMLRERMLSERVRAELTNSVKVTPHRSEEHTSELQSHSDLVCRLLLEKM